MSSSLKTLQYVVPELTEFLDDPDVSEIMINGNGSVYIERAGELHKVGLEVAEQDANELAIHIARINGKDISAERPMVDARLEDGSRIAMVYPPCSVGGAQISIRKFHRQYFSLENLESMGSITTEQSIVLRSMIASRKNVLISGGTSAGKTSLLNAAANTINPDHRVALIEETAEIQIDLPHVIRLQSVKDSEGEERVNHTQMLRAILRQRPDRIIVGETRGVEAYDLLQALNTGHAGSLSTIHANGPLLALNRLGVLVLMALPEMSYDVVQRDIQTAFQYVVQVVRRDGKRYVESIQEIADYDRSDKQFVLRQVA